MNTKLSLTFQSHLFEKIPGLVQGVKYPGQINIPSRGWFLFGGENTTLLQAQKMNSETLIFDNFGPLFYNGIFDVNQCILQVIRKNSINAFY
jgi:hypothetical protein